MITKEGYSKDPSIIPEGVVITFGQSMMEEQGGVKQFLKNFLECMSEYEEGRYWMAKCSNLPKIEVDRIYISVCGRLYGMAYCGGYKRGEATTGTTADGRDVDIDWNYIILSGPFEKCPIKRTLKGFQGFRYSTILF